jgi:pyruvate,water dikinase
VLCGTVQTRVVQGLTFESLAISAHSPESKEDHDCYFLRRTHPFELFQSIIPPRPDGWRFADQRLATDIAVGDGTFARGSALLDLEQLTSLAETAMLLERWFGAPLAVDWEMFADLRCQITRLRPLVMPPVEAAEAAEQFLGSVEEPAAAILCQGGQMVQSGVAAGRVVQVTEQMDPADFPPGAVAVARVASPNLTPVLQRAAAVVTELGTAAGHLATVARELRIPAIFGLPDALSLLPPNTEITVDAGETTVYDGIVDRLLRYGAREMDLSPRDREYRMLRRLLRFIMPLNLVNPDLPNFSPQGCRTFHDIIHFCHEKAVDELAHFQDRRRDLGAIRTRLMALGVPMDIRVLDIGGGLTPDASQEPVPTEVLSEPFGLFLRGLINPQAWTTALPALGVRDILAGMPRSMGMLTAPADSLGANLAIVGRDYINISLRLGYHFSVIDAHLGMDNYRNYVYFRFAGGLADKERRQRRAHFISAVLAAMDFKVIVKGDLVIGRLKLAEPKVLRAALTALGALTAFSRQRDTGLYSDGDTNALFRGFADSFLGDFRNPAAPLPLEVEAAS